MKGGATEAGGMAENPTQPSCAYVVVIPNLPTVNAVKSNGHGPLPLDPFFWEVFYWLFAASRLPANNEHATLTSRLAMANRDVPE